MNQYIELKKITNRLNKLHKELHKLTFEQARYNPENKMSYGLYDYYGGLDTRLESINNLKLEINKQLRLLNQDTDRFEKMLNERLGAIN